MTNETLNLLNSMNIETKSIDDKIIINCKHFDKVCSSKLLNEMINKGCYMDWYNVYMSVPDLLDGLLRPNFNSREYERKCEQPQFELIMSEINIINFLDNVKHLHFLKLKDLMEKNNLKFTSEGTIGIKLPPSCIHDSHFPSYLRDSIMSKENF